MKVTKVARVSSEIDLDNMELLPDVTYKAVAQTVGYLWGGGRGNADYEQKFSVDQKFHFTKPANDFAEIVDGLGYCTGDFQQSWFVSVLISWNIGREYYSFEFTHDNAPDGVKQYFWDNDNGKDLDNFYPDFEHSIW
jgi:hypothetical protein